MRMKEPSGRAAAMECTSIATLAMPVEFAVAHMARCRTKGAASHFARSHGCSHREYAFQVRERVFVEGRYRL